MNAGLLPLELRRQSDVDVEAGWMPKHAPPETERFARRVRPLLGVLARVTENAKIRLPKG